MESAASLEFHPNAVAAPFWRGLRVGVLLAGATCVSAQEATPLAIRRAPYPLDADKPAPIAAELGTLSVPENRDAPESRSLELCFVRLPSTAAELGAPIVYLAGGPGSGGIEALGGPRGHILRRLRAVADVIVLDQRGTGQSSPLPTCEPETELAPTDLTGASIAAYFRREFAHCLAAWRAAGIDPRGYDLGDSVADLEDLRRALGAERLRFVSISFGGQLAMAYMRLHPERVERAVFASPRALHQTLRLPANIDAFLVRVCGEELAERMRYVHACLDEEPAGVTLPARGSSPPVEMRFDSWPVRYIVAFFLLNDARGVAQLPALYAQMEQGDHSKMAASILAFGLDPQRGRFNNFRGMGELMDLSSACSAERLALWRSQLEGSILGDAHGFPLPQGLDLDPSLGIPQVLQEKLVSTTPSLFISASHDGRTPREEVREALSGFAQGQLLCVENGGHNVLEQGEEIEAAVERFLREGTLAAPEIKLPAP